IAKACIFTGLKRIKERIMENWLYKGRGNGGNSVLGGGNPLGCGNPTGLWVLCGVSSQNWIL
ncbi:MAG: hypothetical protein K1X92_16670, partial [Bacteroidia bacterium]|nr:hypothetical protein [Bacteroidia bacterium]